MTTEEIEKRIKKIKRSGGDDEVAHSMEDHLYHDFIAYVATLDNHSLASKAKLILTTKDMDFARWCA